MPEKVTRYKKTAKKDVFYASIFLTFKGGHVKIFMLLYIGILMSIFYAEDGRL